MPTPTYPNTTTPIKVGDRVRLLSAETTTRVADHYAAGAVPYALVQIIVNDGVTYRGPGKSGVVVSIEGKRGTLTANPFLWPFNEIERIA